jgi:hypothetical protein
MPVCKGILMTAMCNHPTKASGVVNLDMSRKVGHEVYTARLSVTICPACGQVELYADAAQYLFDWLSGK